MPALPEPAQHSSGFSLIEVMVALAIFAMAAVALVRLSGLSLSGAVHLSDRALAAGVARNQTIEAILAAAPPGEARGRERAGQREWAWQRRTAPGPVPGTVLVIVEVRGDTGQVIGSDQLLWRAP